ncbi:iron ABC transporter permease [Metabacillus sp. GX 13764]|uniref:FecCD family ABC transporter permease n=1 Tax=Metabacillus kandeliae TaxID=2900151 RepID=UPI001E6445CF|nr:iron ABC transporter permease [Metabacillus kandeliae]MCD7034355.1 iron ABC transporter permease [Metabacillus kandeliae]
MIHPSLLKKQRIVVLSLVLLIAAVIVISLGLGSSSVFYDRILPILFGQGTFKEEFILYSIRMPRIFVTLLAGMALALSGAILQGITKNDLAEPGIIGINSGAGAAVAIFFLFVPLDVGSFVYMLPFAAFIGALITAALIYAFSYSRKQGLQPTRLVLGGVGFSMAFSGLMVVLISSAEREKVDFIAKWLAGNIWGTDWPFVWAILPWLVVLIPFTIYKANRLDLLGLSEQTAIGLGVALERERLLLMTAAVALAASAVSVTGGIAFIGLVAPHIAKALTGPRHVLNIPVSILMGGLLLLVADTIGRNAGTAEGIPAGIIVALIGAPYFLYLLWKKV